jgi:hypothetical protein
MTPLAAAAVQGGISIFGFTLPAAVVVALLIGIYIGKKIF